jgi:hypothetical protein
MRTNAEARANLAASDTRPGIYSIKRGKTKQERFRERNPDATREANRIRAARFRQRKREGAIT